MLKNFRRIFAVCSLLCAVCAGMPARAASNEFQLATQLLAAARAGNVGQVQSLVNHGANVNYIDSTGLSIVCTALMNNDLRAAQILQTYGADASRCDQQIRRFNQRQPSEETEGLFSGLSTAQTMALAIGGAAVAIATVWYVSGLLGVRSNNNNPGDSGSRPKSGNNNPGDSGNTFNSWTYGALPYGPSQAFGSEFVSGTGDKWDYFSAQDNFLNANSPVSATPGPDFQLLSSTLPFGLNLQNHLLLMQGYGALARGYMGMTILRSTGQPFAPLRADVTSNGTPVTFDGLPPGGGKPVSVALISTNGINAGARAVGDPNYATDPAVGGGSSIEDGWLFWAASQGDATKNSTSRRFYNNKITRIAPASTVANDIITEDERFDLAGENSAIYNINASWYDDLLAKTIIGGMSSETGRAYGDYTGFMPNGQLMVFRTGGGWSYSLDTTGGTVKATDAVFTNSTESLQTLDSIEIGGVVYKAFYDSTRTILTLTADGHPALTWYIGNDGLAYTDPGNPAQDIYALNGTDIVNVIVTKTRQDYKNYTAMLYSLGAANENGERMVNTSVTQQDQGLTAQVGVIANAAPVIEMYGTDTQTATEITRYTAGANRRTAFENWINDYYNLTDDAGRTEANNARAFFGGLGSQYNPITIFSTGGYLLGTMAEITNPGFSIGSTQEATFENAAPLVYDGLNHLFMSVVAVQLGNGTPGSTSTGISGWVPASSQKITLSTWIDPYADPNDPNIEFYGARTCGIAGRGSSTVDPWCFAAAGVTDQLAVASMAGAVGALQSAFGSYMSNDQIFVLLALTADGRAMPELDLMDLYQLPGEYQFKVDNNLMTFADAFAEVFGYGLVNLDRATRPGTSVNYYVTNRINSSPNAAFWRTASISPNFAARSGMSLSGAFGMRSASIKIPVFDIIKSADGEMSMPRIFDNSVSLASSRRGMWLGDVLGEFKVANNDSQLGSDGSRLAAVMSLRESHIDDGYGNIDKLKLNYHFGAWNFGARYERNFGDSNILRGDNSNPVLSIASHAVSTDASFNFGGDEDKGGWKFHARGFTGSITEEGLLANDPALSGQRELMKLGSVQGFDTGTTYDAGIFSFGISGGLLNESDTMLGAYSDGLLSIGGGNTVYVDNMLTLRAGEKLKFNARYTAARTDANRVADTVIIGLSGLRSDAMSVGAEYGGFTLSVSQPLALVNGAMEYVTADYRIVESENGFDLAATPYINSLDLSPAHRETRIGAAYRTALGDFTFGAVGFVYRINPNHTTEFGNETLLMFKLNHRLGI
ncbi:MAG: ankyrin repeat domain-containing protein [Alphaproteobacteria bacterium]|nr:ankyrin repeat domain-containing protein [Alphaproteobacteria bacterium]